MGSRSRRDYGADSAAPVAKGGSAHSAQTPNTDSDAEQARDPGDFRAVNGHDSVQCLTRAGGRRLVLDEELGDYVLVDDDSDSESEDTEDYESEDKVQEEEEKELPPGLSLEDFYAYLLEHNYIFKQ